MAYTLKLSNFSIITAEELSLPRANRLVSAVLAARSRIAEARMKSFEALACLQRPGVVLDDLPRHFRLHLGTLFRCGHDGAAFARALGRVAAMLQILDNEICTPELRFKEYGTDLVSTVVNSVASLFGSPVLAPSDVAYVRGFSLSKPGNYIGACHVAGCLNTGHGTGNPNEIMIRLTALDGSLENLTDTVIHEASHKFLGTEDTGMSTSSFNWMRDDGLVRYIEDNPGVPLPIDMPGFLSKTPDEATANAYLLTAYVLYMPPTDITAMTQLNQQARTGPLGSGTPLGQVLRQGLAAQRPPGD